MIHEATLGIGLEEQAIQKKHTCTSQVMELIDKIQPWRTILTHFSPRYQEMPEVLPIHLENKVLVAFDHMRLRLSDLEIAYQFVHIFKQLYDEPAEDTRKPEADPTKKKKPSKIEQQPKQIEEKKGGQGS